MKLTYDIQAKPFRENMAIHYPKTICFNTGNMVLMDDAVVIRCRSGAVAFDKAGRMFIEWGDGVFEFSDGALVEVDELPDQLSKAFKFAREYLG